MTGLSPFTHVQSFAHTFADLETAPFNARDYSRLKFGSDAVAREFAGEMAEEFYRAHSDLLLEERCVVIPSAYNVVEIAATILGRHFMNRLNDLVTRAGGDIVEWTTMHRTVSYLNDYADVSAEERKLLLDRDSLYIKREFIEGKIPIFVDDIYITGTHERKILAFLEELRFKRPAYFCYFAKYVGDRAKIEGDLNRAGIGSLETFLEMLLSEKTHIMVRTLRLWMQAEPDVLHRCLDQVDADYLDALYHAILARGYYTVPELARGFDIIRSRYDSSVAGSRIITAAA